VVLDAGPCEVFAIRTRVLDSNAAVTRSIAMKVRQIGHLDAILAPESVLLEPARAGMNRLIRYRLLSIVLLGVITSALSVMALVQLLTTSTAQRIERAAWRPSVEWSTPGPTFVFATAETRPRQ
jgi:hypothetical protein